jgi:hypothetical protein
MDPKHCYLGFIRTQDQNSIKYLDSVKQPFALKLVCFSLTLLYPVLRIRFRIRLITLMRIRIRLFTMMRIHRQCCGTGTAAFALAEQNRNAFRFRNWIWIRIQHKIEFKGQKIINERPTFW